MAAAADFILLKRPAAKLRLETAAIQKICLQSAHICAICGLTWLICCFFAAENAGWVAIMHKARTKIIRRLRKIV
jgi:Ni,Fe-hydrogenase III large subunit